MKAGWLGVLVGALSILSVAGNALASDAAPTITLTYLTWQPAGHIASTYKPWIDAFEKANPNIKIQVESDASGPTDVAAKLAALSATGDVPDLIDINAYDVPKAIDDHLLLDMTPFYAELGFKKSDYVTSDFFERGGHVYGGYENHAQVFPVFYNIDQVADAGLSSPYQEYKDGNWTWSAFAQMGKKLVRLDGTGRVKRYGAWVKLNTYDQSWAQVLLSDGVKALDPATGKVNIDTPTALQAFDFLVGLVKENVVPPAGFAGGDSLLQNGQIAMEVSGSWNMNFLKSSSIKWDIAPLPAGTSARSYRSFGADALVTAGTKHPLAAAKFNLWLRSQEVQSLMSQSKLVVPMMRSVLSSPNYEQPPPQHMDVIGYELNHSIPLPSFAGAGTVVQILNQGMTPVFQLKASVVSAAGSTAAAAQAKMDELLGKR